MAAKTVTPAGNLPVCPDPSVHDRDHKLSETASTAALYATSAGSRDNPLGTDGKLSSKSAAASLKHAQPHELPSFPSRGGDMSAASAAALLAKDHKVDAYPRPEMSSAGSKAALLAHKDGGKLDLWQPSASSTGNSAAVLAMRNKGLSPEVDRGYTDTGRSNSLLAAAKSAQAGRQRAGSVPSAPQPAYPDSRNSGKNALNAATVSHKASVKQSPPAEGWASEANQAARVRNIHMDSAMFGEHPPVEPEVEEEKRKAAVRASAISMAKQMYDYQKRQEVASDTSSINAGSAGAETAHRRNQSSTSQPDIREEAIRYIHLQDAAHKMAQERLAKVDKEMETTRYREYYGTQTSPKKSRLSVRGRGRKRASSEGQYSDDSDDEEQARRIRTQMSQLSTGINTVGDKQRTEDRAKLLAAAEKRVHDQMHTMDEKVFMDTGKPSQAMMDEWEAKAREKAQKSREEREKHPGKTHVGGGKYMDQSEIEAIAAARLKPTLDELNDTAEKKRARDEAMAAERDRQETEKMDQKMKEQQTKAEFKRIKEQDKAAARKAKEDRKAAERAEKEQAKSRKSEEKRRTLILPQHKFDEHRDSTAAVAGGEALAEVADKVKEDNSERRSSVHDESKDKSGSRGMFGRLADKMKGHDQEQKASIEQTRDAAEKPSMDDTQDKHDDGAALTSVGSGVAAAGGIPDEQPSEPEDDVDRQFSADKRAEDVTKQSAIAAGIAAVGAAVGAGVASPREGAEKEAVEERSLSSGLSTDDDSDDERPDLKTVASSEHTGHYNFAAASPGLERRPDLERHISTIQSSSDSGADDESDDLEDSDDEQFYGRPATGHLEEPLTPASTRRDGAGVPARDTPIVVETSRFEEPPRAVGEASREAESPVSPLHSDEEKKETAIVAPVIVPTTAGGSESPAPAPAVKTGPTDKEQDKEKDRKGVRGFFSKLRNKSKSENKLQKDKSTSSTKTEEKSFEGGAKYTAPVAAAATGTAVATQASDAKQGEERKPIEHMGTDGPIGDSRQISGIGGDPRADSPSKLDELKAQQEERAATEHMGTDGPIGDSKHVSGIGGDPRATSPSSFKRHDENLKDLDDVSSSGVDEEELSRGRGGRLARKLGLKKDKGKAKDSTELEKQESGVSTEQDQFEEARDHFDESLAPPPAFAGQAKSASPTRETRFQEQL